MNAPLDNPTNYHARVLGEASSSALKEFRKSELQYLDWVNNGGKQPTAPMRLGTAFHMAMHEPARFARTYVTIPDMSLNSKSAKQDFLDLNYELIGSSRLYEGESAEVLRNSTAADLTSAGVHVLTEKSLATLRAMSASLNMPCHSLARGLVARGEKEKVLRWKDRDSGVQCKALLDSWDQPIAVLSDLKQTTAITERACRYQAIDFGYDFQLTFYRRALREHELEAKRSYLVCGSPEPPYLWAVYDIPEERVEWCDERITEDLLRLAECVATNTWQTINRGEPRTLQIRTEREAA